MRDLNPRAVIAFWDDKSKDPFTTIMRIALAVAYIAAVIGVTLSGPETRSSGEWWQMLGMSLYTFGICTIIVGHVLLGYAVYRRQKQFAHPGQAAKRVFKSIFLYMYLPAFVITILLFIPVILRAL